MPVQRNQVQVGAFFITTSDQLRKVTQIETDAQSRERVHYLSKSTNYPNREFNYGGTKANPQLMDNFIMDCDHLLNDEEILQLRRSNIILSNE